MLSAAAFNALLKTLEEPPPRSLFVFATTNPEKIPFTVVSRCQRYDLRRLATAEVAARLREVAAEEGLRISEVEPAGPRARRRGLAARRAHAARPGDRRGRQRAGRRARWRRSSTSSIPSCCSRPRRRVRRPRPGGARSPRAPARPRPGIDAKRLAGSLVKQLRDLVVLRLAPDRPELVDASEARARRAARPRRARRAGAPAPHVPRADPRAGGPRLGARALRGARDGGGAPRDPRGRRRGRRAARAPRRPRAAPRRRRGRRGPRGRRAGPRPRARRAARRGSSGAGTRAPKPRQAAPGADLPPGAVFDHLRVFAQRENRGLFAALEGGRVIHWDGVAAAPRAARRRSPRSASPRAAPISRRSARASSGGRCASSSRSPTRRGAAASAREASKEAEEARRREALNHPAVNAALEILDGEILEIRPLGSAPRERAGPLASSWPGPSRCRAASRTCSAASRCAASTASAGGGMVTAVASGALRIRELRIEPEPARLAATARCSRISPPPR